MLPDRDALRLLAPTRRRLIARDLSDAVLAGAAGAATVAALAALVADPRLVRGLAVTVASGIAMAAGLWSHRRWTRPAVALEVERRSGAFDNLLVTAEAIDAGRLAATDAVAREIRRQAEARSVQVHAARLVPIAAPMARAALVAAAAAAFVVIVPRGDVPRDRTQAEVTQSPAPGGIRALTVTVTPPAYTGRPPASFEEPTEMQALAGSRLHIHIASDAPAVTLTSADGTRVPLEVEAGTHVGVLEPRSTGVWVVQAAGDARLLAIEIEPDRAPAVRLSVPGRDLILPDAARRQVALGLEADDDIGLRDLRLVYTRVSGGGETFTFEEAELPLQVRRRSPTAWSATATLALDRLGLEDGDLLVYRAVARDRRPGGEPALSESFFIEIGGVTGASSEGFALPEDDRRYALSQRMVVQKTERLHARRAGTDREAWMADAQALAVEQRMVRAEFVFLTGGEVEDEVEEAAHSHELAEGRFENAAQIALLAAIRAMSRAEARLRDGDTAGALVHERIALAEIQKALDRRRYFLRTLPERSRLDGARRLSGSLADAAGWTRPDLPPAPQLALATLRTLVGEVARARQESQRPDPALVARVAAFDPNAPALRAAALAWGAATEPSARRLAAGEVLAILGERTRAELGAPAEPAVPRDPLAGRIADAPAPPGGGRR